LTLKEDIVVKVPAIPQTFTAIMPSGTGRLSLCRATGGTRLPFAYMFSDWYFATDRTDAIMQISKSGLMEVTAS